MSAPIIRGAGYGDENSWADVTSTLQKMLKEKGYINVIADKSLIPRSEGTTSITSEEKEDILKQAEIQCGGGSDKKCIDERTDTLTRSKLAQKADELKIPKGEKLTVGLIENGRYVLKHIAKGQPLTIGNPPDKSKPIQPSSETGVSSYLMYALLLFVWGVNVLLTWLTFRTSSTYVRYGTTAVAAIVPPSGFLMVLVYYLLLIYKQRQNA